MSDDNQADVAVFEALIDALLDPADRGRRAVPASGPRGGEGPRSDAFNAPTGSSGDRGRGRRRGGRRRPDRGSHGGPAQR